MKKSEVQIFNELIESIGQAEGSASQLVHRTGHPVQFMFLRDALAMAKKGFIKISPHNRLMRPRTVFTK
mgnify:CR=1 FL=1